MVRTGRRVAWGVRGLATAAILTSPLYAGQSNRDQVPPPPGFVSFCVRFPGQCGDAAGPLSVVLTKLRWRIIRQVNTQVNEAISPEDDSIHYGRPEYWTIPADGYGDCEDYGLSKRKELFALGFPLRALRMAIVNAPGEARHAVLVVVTDQGNFVLDNLNNDIVDARLTPYTWLEEQDANNPRAWISLLPALPSQTATASVK